MITIGKAPDTKVTVTVTVTVTVRIPINLPINVSVVTIFCLVLNVARINGNLTSLFFGSAIDFFVRQTLAPSLIRQYLGDCLRERGLSVINVPNGANVHVRLGPIERRGKASGDWCTARVQSVHVLSKKRRLAKEKSGGVHHGGIER